MPADAVADMLAIKNKITFSACPRKDKLTTETNEETAKSTSAITIFEALSCVVV